MMIPERPCSQAKKQQKTSQEKETTPKIIKHLLAQTKIQTKTQTLPTTQDWTFSSSLSEVAALASCCGRELPQVLVLRSSRKTVVIKHFLGHKQLTSCCKMTSCLSYKPTLSALLPSPSHSQTAFRISAPGHLKALSHRRCPGALLCRAARSSAGSSSGRPTERRLEGRFTRWRPVRWAKMSWVWLVKPMRGIRKSFGKSIL